MARLRRYFLKGQPLRVIQRDNDRQAIFFKPDDYTRYYNWLAEAADDYGCAVRHGRTPLPLIHPGMA